ncbi:hypothetical protein K523DRAFT_321465 [Schizophyllum commune Tattone D]|nr:hypothetical protein K523DRAFT_321465 [Schizophyllum commune Tattone D]
MDFVGQVSRTRTHPFSGLRCASRTLTGLTYTLLLLDLHSASWTSTGLGLRTYHYGRSDAWIPSTTFISCPYFLSFIAQLSSFTSFKKRFVDTLHPLCQALPR